MKTQFWYSPQQKVLQLSGGFKFENQAYDGVFLNSSYTEAQKQQLMRIVKNNFDYGNNNQLAISVAMQTLNADFYYEAMILKTNDYPLLRLLIKPYLDEELTTDDIVLMNQQAQIDFGNTQSPFAVRTLSHLQYLTDFAAYPYLFGINQLPTIVDRAVYFWMDIARFQTFINGNKRTALMAMLTYLYKNFYVLPDEPDVAEELYQLTKGVAVNSVTDDELTTFLLNHLILNFAAVEEANSDLVSVQLENPGQHIFTNVVQPAENKHIYQVLQRLAAE